MAIYLWGNKKLKKDQKIGYKYELIPIDHSLSIPDNLEVYSYDICWMDWKQSEEKFSEKSLAYINSIDVLKDITILDHEFKFREIWLKNIRITGTLLRKGAAAGLTLNQIGKMLCREDDFDDDDDEKPSLIEEIVERAQIMAKNRRSFHHYKEEKKIRSLEFSNNERIKPQHNVSKFSSLKMKNYDRILGEEEKKQ